MPSLGALGTIQGPGTNIFERICKTQIILDTPVPVYISLSRTIDHHLAMLDSSGLASVCVAMHILSFHGRDQGCNGFDLQVTGY